MSRWPAYNVYPCAVCGGWARPCDGDLDPVEPREGCRCSSTRAWRGPAASVRRCLNCGLSVTLPVDCRRECLPPTQCTCAAREPQQPPPWDPHREQGRSTLGPIREGPVCWDMLDSPAAVLSDRSRWARHLCRDMLEESIDLWAERVVPKHPAAYRGCSCFNCLHELATHRLPTRDASERPLRAWRRWPLAVGEEVTGHAWSNAPLHSVEHGDSQHVAWAPLEGREFAALILDFSVEGTRLELFGTGTAADGWSTGTDGGAARKVRGRRSALDVSGPYSHFAGDTDLPVVVFGPLRMRMTGEISARAFQLAKAAQTWWRIFEGMPAGGTGRPPANREAQYPDVLNAIRLLHSEATADDWSDPRLDEASIGQRMTVPVSDRTVRRILKRVNRSLEQAIREANSTALNDS